MELKTEAVIFAAVALAIIYLAKQAKDAAGQAVSDAQDAIMQAAADTWTAAKNGAAQAVTAVNDTTFGTGQTVNSTIPLYEQKNQTAAQKPTNYNPGSIFDGAIF